MSANHSPAELVEIPTFFAPGAFELVRQGHSAIAYNPDALTGAAHFLTDEAGVDLPEDPTTASYIYRFGEGGFKRAEPDPNFRTANPSSPYIPAGQLAIGTEMRPSFTTKAGIQTLRRPIVQIQMREDLNVPLVAMLASSLLYNPAEDHRMLASPAAWLNQFKVAFGIRRPNEHNTQRIITEVTSRFAGAIVLHPRKTKNS